MNLVHIGKGFKSKYFNLGGRLPVSESIINSSAYNALGFITGA